jgi:pimeloyl-ACP methyl ester carboxylesterase
VLLSVDGREAYAYTARREFNAALTSVVFIHGAANDHSVWNLQSRYFAYHARNTLAVDLPGHGRSVGPALTSVERLALWIVALLDTLKIERAALVGHSMGSLIALECAARHGARVKKIALVGTSVPMPVSKTLLDASAANDHAAFDMINLWGHGPAAQIGGNTVPGAWMMGSYLRLLERAAPGVLHTDFAACNGYVSGLDAAQRVTCPALLVLGQRDQMTPAKAARELGANIKGARTVVLEGSGHALMSEAPDRVLDALIQFL